MNQDELLPPTRVRSGPSTSIRGAAAIFPESEVDRTDLVADIAKTTLMTRMYGPAVRRKRFSSSWRFWVLHQCIRPLIGACCAPGHHGYQRACDLIKRQASTGQVGHQCSHAPRRPILHRRLILSQTSAGKLTTSSIAPHFALFLCSCLAAVPSSRPAGYRRAARRGGQGWPLRGPCHLLHAARPPP